MMPLEITSIARWWQAWWFSIMSLIATEESSFLTLSTFPRIVGVNLMGRKHRRWDWACDRNNESMNEWMGDPSEEITLHLNNHLYYILSHLILLCVPKKYKEKRKRSCYVHDTKTRNGKTNEMLTEDWSCRHSNSMYVPLVMDRSCKLPVAKRASCSNWKRACTVAKGRKPRRNHREEERKDKSGKKKFNQLFIG